MKRLSATALLICLVAAAYAEDDSKPQTTIPRVEKGDIPPQAGRPEGEPRVVSREGIEYLQRLRRNTPFGTTTLSKNVWQNGEEPEISLIGDVDTPGDSMSKSRKLMPSCFGFDVSVRTRQKIQSA